MVPQVQTRTNDKGKGLGCSRWYSTDQMQCTGDLTIGAPRQWEWLEQWQWCCLPSQQSWTKGDAVRGGASRGLKSVRAQLVGVYPQRLLGQRKEQSRGASSSAWRGQVRGGAGAGSSRSEGSGRGLAALNSEVT
jgi:hypothetical protein